MEQPTRDPVPPPADGPLDDALRGAAAPATGTGTGLRHLLLVRHRHNWLLLAKFSIVGGSGFFVNLAMFWLLLHLVGNHEAKVLALGVGDFNVRNYHVFAMLAFIVANISNYVLNRWWTFESHGTASVVSEYVPFLTIGLVAQGIGLLLLTALVKLAGLGDTKTEVGIAQAITIVLVTPVSFVGNKLWTFRAVRDHHRAHLDLGRR